MFKRRKNAELNGKNQICFCGKFAADLGMALIFCSGGKKCATIAGA